jgi:hypothetical protein
MSKDIENKYIDLTGKIFGKLRVLSFLDKHNGKIRWNCLCECGRMTKTSTSNFLHHNVSSCGKCNPSRYKKYEEIPYEFFYRIKQNADKRNYYFDISIEDIWNLFIKQNKKCAISGLDISVGDGRDYSDTRTASLDRIDSSKGYTIDNIQWIHKKINRMKMDLSDQEFINMCKIISNFQELKEYNNE